MAKVIHSSNAWGSKRWGNKIRLGITTFVDMEIVSDSGYNLSLKDAKRLIDDLISAVNEVESREGK